MKAINLQTLDEWLFDYFENNLSEDERILLTEFLNQNPVCKTDFDAWKLSYVKEPEFMYSKTEQLLKKNTGGSWFNRGNSQIFFMLLAGGIITIICIQSFLFNSPNTKQEYNKMERKESHHIDVEPSKEVPMVSTFRETKPFSTTKSSPFLILPISDTAAVLGHSDKIEPSENTEQLLIENNRASGKQESKVAAPVSITEGSLLQDTTKSKPPRKKKKIKIIPVDVGF